MKFRGIMMPALVTLSMLYLSVVPLVSCDKRTELDARNSNAKIKSHDLILGQVGYSDRLLYKQTVHIPSKLFRTVEKDYKLPTGYPTSIITSIVIHDLKTDGTGGYPSVVSGGIGTREVTIRLKSQRNHGIHFDIALYGR